MNIPAALLPKKTFPEYMAQYRSEHTKLGTKLTHMVGIPMIVASFPAAVVSPPAAGALFAGGWALQFAGHYFFEKQKPSFFADPYFTLIGVVWAGVEWAELLGLPLPEVVSAAAHAEQEPADAPHAAHTNGAPSPAVTAAHEAAAAV